MTEKNPREGNPRRRDQIVKRASNLASSEIAVNPSVEYFCLFEKREPRIVARPRPKWAKEHVCEYCGRLIVLGPTAFYDESSESESWPVCLPCAFNSGFREELQ